MAYFKQKYITLLSKIWKYSNKLYLPTNKTIITTVNTDSWFDIEQTNYTDNTKQFDAKLKKKHVKSTIKCDKIKMYPTPKQRKILISWMNSYIKMYNETISFFKRYYTKHNKVMCNWYTVRTTHLRHIKKKIIETSGINQCKSNIYAHILDLAIKQACASYKSCLTNLKNGNIKKFRLRHLKYSKRNKILIIEKGMINKKKNNICSSIFKNAFKLKNNFLMKNIKKDFIIHYDSKTSEFYLYYPQKVIIDQYKSNKKNTISLDPGIRKFLVGFTNDKTIKFCTNLKNKIGKSLNKIRKAKNKKTYRKVEKHYYKKIKNCVDDMHWKTIKYLTNNYSNILIGNMCTKSIVNNKYSNLTAKTKEIAMLMRLGVFKCRLQHKCNINKVGYKEVDEAYTSKTCTKCGYINITLGGNEIFTCTKCKYTIDRDINGARNILLRNINIHKKRRSNINKKYIKYKQMYQNIKKY